MTSAATVDTEIGQPCCPVLVRIENGWLLEALRYWWNAVSIGMSYGRSASTGCAVIGTGLVEYRYLCLECMYFEMTRWSSCIASWGEEEGPQYLSAIL